MFAFLAEGWRAALASEFIPSKVLVHARQIYFASVCSVGVVAALVVHSAIASNTAMDWSREHIQQSARIGLFGMGPTSRHPLFNLCFPWMLQTYMISGVACFSLEQVCVAAKHPLPPATRMRQWLNRHESGRGMGRMDVRLLYLEYHTARLMRLFLKAASSVNDCVIAGGYAACKFMEQQTRVTWAPGDIDFFTTSEDSGARLLQCFREKVATPLCVEVTERISHRYPDSDDEDSSASWSGSEEDVPKFLNDEVSEWIAGLDPSENDASQQLWGILEMLPKCFDPPNYEIIKTTKTEFENPSVPAISPITRFSVASLLPINIIHIKLLNQAEDPRGMAEIVCSNFDMAQCCVSVSFGEEGEYYTRCFSRAIDALRQERIILQPRAFCTGPNAVEVQMRRVMKYIGRGFRAALA